MVVKARSLRVFSTGWGSQRNGVGGMGPKVEVKSLGLGLVLVDYLDENEDLMITLEQ